MRITRQARSSFLLAALIAGAPSLFADYVPDCLASRHKSETTLARININQPVKRAVALYGKPTSIRHETDGVTKYAWNKGDLRIEISTEVDPDARTERIDSIRITGNRSVLVARTGAGVRLGDELEQLVAKYGYRYQTPAPHTVLFTFSDTALAARFSDDGEIVSLELSTAGG